MSCEQVLLDMKSTMQDTDLLPRLFSEPNCQGEMLTMISGQYQIPFSIRSMIIPFTFQIELIDSEHRWSSLLDHDLHGEIIEDTDEIIEQWYNEAETYIYYQSWSEANMTRVKQGDESYYEMTRRQCEETQDPEWCQYVVEEKKMDVDTDSAWWFWCVFILAILLFVILVHVQKKEQWWNQIHLTRVT